MKLGLAQLNPTIGNNLGLILETIAQARKLGVQLLVFPELSLTGYPPRDLMDCPDFVANNLKALNQIVEATDGLTVVCGFIDENKSGLGCPFLNSAIVIRDRKELGRYSKQLLPNYDVFDESRHFQSGEGNFYFELEGKKIALTICEDLWDREGYNDRHYSLKPIHHLKDGHPDIVLNLSASPFSLGKTRRRVELFKEVARDLSAVLICCNQVGGNDELIFDGGSFVLDSRGEVLCQLPVFQSQLSCYDLNDKKTPLAPWPESEEAYLYEALSMGLRDYVHKSGQKSVCLGLSGGIDSAVAAVLAVEALGRGSVFALGLPTRFTATESLEGAQKLVQKLQIPYRLCSIESIFQLYESLWKDWFSEKPGGLVAENLQPRIRMSILMGYSNQSGHLLLNTSNKSEIATGYSTLYGDGTGAISILGDLTKTQVYSLAKYINREEELIPNLILSRKPSAELREGQIDQDTLPPYEVLDQIINDVLLGHSSRESLLEEGHKKEWVDKFFTLYNGSEYKRWQFPPILRVSDKAFGMGRRIPLTKNEPHYCRNGR